MDFALLAKFDKILPHIKHMPLDVLQNLEFN